MSVEQAFRLLIAEDEAKLRSVVSRELARRGFVVTVAEDGDQAAKCLEKQVFDVLLLDVRMPGKDGLEVLRLAQEIEPPPEAVMLTGNSTVGIAVEAMKLGAYDFITKPCPLDALDQTLRRACEKRDLRRENEAMKRRLKRESGTVFVYSSKVMRRTEQWIERIAPSDGTVLIIGESGTGKELAAHAVHAASQRAEAPFVDVNCGAIPETLLESELFGHEKGAFTGADASRPGLFEMAHGGSLFLDEIGELPMGLQVKLLRVLENKTFYRIGGRRQTEVDVRVIAATNRNLAEEIDSGGFRRDLYFRLNALEIRLPPLRERVEDILPLAQHFAAPRKISPGAMERLAAYSWPGNVRELKNVVERAILITSGDLLEPDDFPAELIRRQEPATPPGATVSGGSAGPPEPAPVATDLRELEKQQVLAVLEQVHWHRGKAAELLGISPKTLYRKLKAYGIG